MEGRVQSQDRRGESLLRSITSEGDVAPHLQYVALAALQSANHSPLPLRTLTLPIRPPAAESGLVAELNAADTETLSMKLKLLGSRGSKLASIH